MSEYVLGSDAVLDLEDIWDYIAADSADAADKCHPPSNMGIGNIEDVEDPS